MSKRTDAMEEVFNKIEVDMTNWCIRQDYIDETVNKFNTIKQELSKLDKIREVVERSENAEKGARYKKLRDIKSILEEETK